MKPTTEAEPHGWTLNVTCRNCGHRGDLNEVFPCCEHVEPLRARIRVLEEAAKNALEWCERSLARESHFRACDAEPNCTCHVAVIRGLEAALAPTKTEGTG